MVPLDLKAETEEGMCLIYVMEQYPMRAFIILLFVLYTIEPHVVAHVQLKCELTPKTEKDVIFKIQESIEKTAQIKSVSIIV